MLRILYRCAAAISVLLLVADAWAAARPKYGGTLRLEFAAAPVSLDPAMNDGTAASLAAAALEPLVFETLVTFDRQAIPRPALALDWRHDVVARQWRFTIRNGVTLHDSTTLTPALVAEVLSAVHRDWRVSAEGAQVVIDTGAPDTALLEELALPQNAVVARSPSGALAGSGPFLLRDHQPGRQIVLLANPTYWGGRPFVDQIEVTLGRSPADQWLDFQLGRADAIELAPDQVRRVGEIGGSAVSSAPVQLIALRFAPGSRAAGDASMRQAFALALDRTTIENAILQHQGAASAGLLPDWVTGYGFLFSATRDLARARSLLSGTSAPIGLTVTFDPSDATAQLITERVAVDAAQAGLPTRAMASGPSAADAEIVRLKIPSGTPCGALVALTGELHRGASAASAALRSAPPNDYQACYAAERELLSSFNVVPLAHVPEVYAISGKVKGWSEPPRGGLPLADVWLASVEPR